MLTEIKDARQVPNEGFRRWFTDDDSDLIVWFEDDEITGFQLCYDKFTTERAITWFKKGGFVHTKVDSGEPAMGGPKSTPVLVSDGVFERDVVTERFKEISANVESHLVDFIVTKLGEYIG